MCTIFTVHGRWSTTTTTRDPSHETPCKRLLTRNSSQMTPLARDSLRETPCKRLCARDSLRETPSLLETPCKRLLLLETPHERQETPRFLARDPLRETPRKRLLTARDSFLARDSLRETPSWQGMDNATGWLQGWGKEAMVGRPMSRGKGWTMPALLSVWPGDYRGGAMRWWGATQCQGEKDGRCQCWQQQLDDDDLTTMTTWQLWQRQQWQG